MNSRSGAAERVKALGLWSGILAALLALMLTSPSSLAGTKILVTGSDYSANENDFVSKLTGTGLFSQVDLMDLQNTTPTLAQLQQYAAVLVWSDFNLWDATTLGDNLASYVSGGGGVVVANWALQDGLKIGGAFDSGGYLSVTLGSGYLNQSGLT